MRPPAGTLADFPAPPPPGSNTPDGIPAHAPSAPSSAAGARDPLEVAREAIGELTFLDDARLAASICCGALVLALGARAVIIHAHDARAKQLRVVAANGPATESLIGKTTRVDDDVVASTVVMMGKPMTVKIDPEVGLPSHAPERFRVVGVERAIVATPAVVKKRVVAIVEVIDARGAAATAVEPAAEYAGLALARFLVELKKR